MKKRFLFAIRLVLLCAFVFNPSLPNARATEAVKEITVHGTLKRTVESGGWIVVTAGKKYLILNFKKFEHQPWFIEGKEVEVTGKVKSVVTTYMEGTPFEASSMRPFKQSRRRHRR
jgi:hypothetical protein